MRSVHVMIKGRVQGVGYRAWAAHEARARNLSGWVRNRRNGDVEAVFCGLDNQVEEMLGVCSHGPGWARVDDMTVNIAPPASDEFTILETV